MTEWRFKAVLSPNNKRTIGGMGVKNGVGENLPAGPTGPQSSSSHHNDGKERERREKKKMIQLNELIHQLIQVSIQGLGLFVFGTVFFDVLHVLVHRYKVPVLSRWHNTHHLYFPRNLLFLSRHEAANLSHHLTLEALSQAIGTALLWLCLRDLSSASLSIGLLIVFVKWAVQIGWLRGRDENHVEVRDGEVLGVCTDVVLVGPDYHRLHHVHPDAYFSSLVQVVDWALGTACSLAGRRFAVSGTGGALGGELARLLRRCGATVLPLVHAVDFDGEGRAVSERARVALSTADVLVLAHGTLDQGSSEAANYTSWVGLAQEFVGTAKPPARMCKSPIEIWAVGSEAEFHPFYPATHQPYVSAKRKWAAWAKKLSQSGRVLYRHIVPSTFRSGFGFGPIPASWVARASLFLIARGCRFVPVTYTGIALLYLPVWKLTKW